MGFRLGEYSQMMPHVREVLRQTKGEDAEMQYILGVATSKLYPGAELGPASAANCFKRAIELKPGYQEAIDALAKEEGDAPPAKEERKPPWPRASLRRRR